MLIHPWVRNVLIASIAGFASVASAGPFDKGATSFSLVVGAGTAFNQRYTIVGAGIDYFVLDGLQVGVDAQAWMGGDVSIYKVTPQARYVMNLGALKPYVGVFYRKSYVENLNDLESAGGRAGVVLQTRGNYSMSAGYVYESYLDCDESIYNTCSESYPELRLSISL